MREQHQTRLKWQTIFSAIALAVGTLGSIGSPAEAFPEVENQDFQLAQVGVRSRINSPTPINLRPRTHTPLPTNSSSKDYYRHSGSNYRYRGSHGRYNRHHEYGHHHGHHGHHRSRRRRGTVIIINPSHSSSYSKYSNQNGHIRIIRK